MSAALFLGLDVGTQGTKGLLFDAESGRVLARASSAYGLIPGLPDTAAEQHPSTWLTAIETVCRALFAQNADFATRVAGVAVSGQQHGLVVMDASWHVLRAAKLWCDTSTVQEARELEGLFGQVVPVGYTASKLLWLKRNEPELWSLVRHVCLPHDFINHVLTGNFEMEAGDASGLGFFDLETRSVDVEKARCIDNALPGMLPAMLEAGALQGLLNATGAELLGLPEGIPVAHGGGDNMMSAIGSGATHVGPVVVSLGTSGTVFCYSDQAIRDPEGLIAPFCDSTGGYLPLLCVMNLTGVLHEVREAFAESSLEALTEEATHVEVGADGLLFLPYLVGERVPDLPDATGLLSGIRPGLLRPGHLFRAALEGCSLNLALGVARMRKLGLQIDSMRLVGGAARNPLWQQILADVLGVPLTVQEECETAAFGAALHALWTIRKCEDPELSCEEATRTYLRNDGPVIEPVADNVKRYEALRERFEALLAKNFGASFPSSR